MSEQAQSHSREALGTIQDVHAAFGKGGHPVEHYSEVAAAYRLLNEAIGRFETWEHVFQEEGRVHDLGRAVFRASQSVNFEAAAGPKSLVYFLGGAIKEYLDGRNNESVRQAQVFFDHLARELKS